MKTFLWIYLISSIIVSTIYYNGIPNVIGQDTNKAIYELLVAILMMSFLIYIRLKPKE